MGVISKLFKITAILGLTLFHVNAQQLAFPGAEGFGRFATGGRGGEVYHVTNLNSSGAGSFRDAVSKSNRIVVFDVGGVIDIRGDDRIVIQKNIYVAGQTAPGGGITIYGNGVALNSSSGNSIIRFLRIRMGDQGDYRKDALGISDGQDYMFDNVSVSWGWDGTLDVNGANIDNITFQDCIIAQGIDVVGHSTGGLFQSGKWSMIRSIYIDNNTRNPKGKGTHEFINNIIYNWGSDGYIMGATDGLSEVNCIGNHFIYGPSSKSNSHITRTTEAFHVYAKDNWIDDNKNGVYDAYEMTDYKTATVVSTPFDYDGTQYAMSASEALEYVLYNAGGSFPARDAVDEFLIDEIRSYGTKGKIIKRESDNGIPNNVGTVANGTPPTDTDRDGMPDVWEIARGLDPNTQDHNGDDDGDGYTNIEEYLSELAGDVYVAPKDPEVVVYTDTGDKQYSTSANWDKGYVPTSVDTAIIKQGEAQLKNSVTNTIKVQSDAIFRMIGFISVPQIYLQGGTIQINTSNDSYGLEALVEVENPSTIMCGANPITIFNSNMVFSGDASLSKTSSGTLQLQKSSPNFSGNWFVKGGKFRLRAPNAAGSGSIIVSDSSIVDVEAVGGLSGCDSLVLMLGSTITIDAATDTVSYLKLGEKTVAPGTYTNSDYPEYIGGVGALTVLYGVQSPVDPDTVVTDTVVVDTVVTDTTVIDPTDPDTVVTDTVVTDTVSTDTVVTDTVVTDTVSTDSVLTDTVTTDVLIIGSNRGNIVEALPNPMTPNGFIRYDLKSEGALKLVIYDNLGRTMSVVRLSGKAGKVMWRDLHIYKTGVYTAVIYNKRKEQVRVQFYY